MFTVRFTPFSNKSHLSNQNMMKPSGQCCQNKTPALHHPVIISALLQNNILLLCTLSLIATFSSYIVMT